MKLYRALADGLLEAHPLDAARVLESLPEGEALDVLAAAPPAVAGATIRHVAAHQAAGLLARLDRARAGAVVESLGPEVAANILRRMEAQPLEALLGSVAQAPARSVRTLLRFPEGTAGALMDPNVLALPADLSADEALAHMRRSPESVRYNLYVVDREQVLVGVLNLRELLLAARKDLLRSIGRAEVLSLPAAAGRHAILNHPAWREARSVPVVDERGVYLGAVRYETMRRLEEELRRGDAEGGPSTVEALGDLFSTGIAGVFGAFAASVARPFPGSPNRDA
jgi:magnesium transporter